MSDAIDGTRATTPGVATQFEFTEMAVRLARVTGELAGARAEAASLAKQCEGVTALLAAERFESLRAREALSSELKRAQDILTLILEGKGAGQAKAADGGEAGAAALTMEAIMGRVREEMERRHVHLVFVTNVERLWDAQNGGRTTLDAFTTSGWVASVMVLSADGLRRVIHHEARAATPGRAAALLARSLGVPVGADADAEVG